MTFRCSGASEARVQLQDGVRVSVYPFQEWFCRDLPIPWLVRARCDFDDVACRAAALNSRSSSKKSAGGVYCGLCSVERRLGMVFPLDRTRAVEGECWQEAKEARTETRR